VHQFHRNSLKTPCSLCGVVHPGRIHDYVERKYRDREKRENTVIVVPVIVCSIAQDQGKQYTKRLLPDFLIPRSVIRLDYVLEAARLPANEQSMERVCDLLGCIDPRTARSRMRALTEAIGEVSLDLSRERASRPELGEVPHTSPDTSLLERLEGLYEAECSARERAGTSWPLPPSLRQLLQAAMGKHRGEKPSTSVSSPARPP
jgi:hypothetical protein